MLRQIQKSVYLFLAKYKIFYPLLFRILIKKGYLEEDFDKIIKRYSNKNKNLFFIQIGANDGMKFDPTYLYAKKYRWKGILVEPVDYVFGKLKNNYRGFNGLIFENVAIGEKNGFKKFYMLKKSEGEDIPLWYDEIGSFFKENVIKHRDRIKDLDKRLITKKIKVLTLKSLLERHKVNRIDFLQIDTEGYDYHILKQIPFDKIKPSMIVFEDRHLPKNQKEYCQRLLIDNGYTIVRGLDCFAYLRSRQP